MYRKTHKRFYDTLKELSGKVVGRYISRGAIPEREREDVETAIIEKFLIKQDKIESAFQDRAKKSTYYIAILNRMCAEVIRKEQKHWYKVNTVNDFPQSDDSTFSFETSKHTLLQEELKRFKTCITLFNGLQPKVILFLKYYYGIPLQESDITNYSGNYSNKASEILSERNNLSKTDVNEKLAKLVYIIEQKDISGDAVRMWINKQIDIILRRLNGKDSRCHNKETIGIMLEMQYHNKETNTFIKSS